MPGIRSGAPRAIAVAVLCAVPWLALAGADYPEPELHASTTVSEDEVDALPPGDPRRGPLLVRLAVRRHADADETTPTQAARIGAMRAQAVSFAQRALDEAPSLPELPDALIAGGLDAERLGRTREALRLLGALLRNFPASVHVGDAWLALGEHHLRSGELTRARVALEEAQKHGRPPVRSWAASRMSELAARLGAP